MSAMLQRAKTGLNDQCTEHSAQILKNLQDPADEAHRGRKFCLYTIQVQ